MQQQMLVYLMLLLDHSFREVGVRLAFRSHLDTIAGKHGAVAGKHDTIAGKHGAIAGCSCQRPEEARRNRPEAWRNRREARRNRRVQLPEEARRNRREAWRNHLQARRTAQSPGAAARQERAFYCQVMSQTETPPPSYILHTTFALLQ